MNKQEEIHTGIDYQEKYKQLGDAAIREILLKRKSYQAEAARAAVQEAISRGMLQSEQDLFSEEYNPPPGPSGFLFPTISKPEHKAKIWASLHRIFYVLGLIPFVFAGMNYFRENLFPALVFGLIGTGWWTLNFGLAKIKSMLLLKLMLASLIVGFAYAMYSVSILKSPAIMDFAVVIIAFLISLYCLLFARSILKNETSFQ